MKRLALILLLALAALPALGQCLPSYVDPKGPGTDSILVETPYVEGRVGWCLESRTAAGDHWKMAVFQWCLKRVCAAVPPTLNPWRVIDQIRAASSPMAAASALMAQHRVPLSDPADVVRYQQWRYDACVALTTPPYTLTPTPFKPFPAGYCGTRPADPGEAWRTVGGTLFTYSGARLTGLVSGRRAAAGVACNCEVMSTTSGGKRYCSVVITTTTPATGEAAECRKVTL